MLLEGTLKLEWATPGWNRLFLPLRVGRSFSILYLQQIPWAHKHKVATPCPIFGPDLAILPLGLSDFPLSVDNHLRPERFEGSAAGDQHVIQEDHTPFGSLNRISKGQRPTSGMAC